MNERMSNFDSDYSVTQEVHEIVQKYNPIFIARGSESLVYVPTREGREMISVVFKVDILSVADCVMWLEENSEMDLDDYAAQRTKIFEDRQQRQHEVNEEVSSYFGSESVPRERTFFCRVPATPILLEKAMNHYEKSDYSHHEVMAQVTMQTLHIEALDPDTPSIFSSFLEIDQSFEGLDAIQHKFVHRPEGSVISEEEKDKIFYETPFKNLLKRIEEDPEIAKITEDFVKNAISYTSETGKILDFVGPNNVVLMEGDDPRFLIVDGIYLDAVNQTEKAQNLIDESFSEGIADEKITGLITVIKYVRTVNALAAVLSIPDRLCIFNAIEAFDDEQVSTNYSNSLISQYRKLMM